MSEELDDQIKDLVTDNIKATFPELKIWRSGTSSGDYVFIDIPIEVTDGSADDVERVQAHAKVIEGYLNRHEGGLVGMVNDLYLRAAGKKDVIIRVRSLPSKSPYDADYYARRRAEFVVRRRKPEQLEFGGQDRPSR